MKITLIIIAAILALVAIIFIYYGGCNKNEL